MKLKKKRLIRNVIESSFEAELYAVIRQGSVSLNNLNLKNRDLYA